MCCSYYHSIIENSILATNKMIPHSYSYNDNLQSYDVLIMGGTVFPGTEWTHVRRRSMFVSCYFELLMIIIYDAHNMYR